MKKILVFSLSLIALSISVLAQESTPTAQKRFARPNIPGTFTVELGINRGVNRPEKFMLYFWGSRSLNIYYQYDMRILKSKFSFHPGVGFGLDRYRFRNGYVLGYDQGVLAMQTTLDYRTDISRLKKSQLITNYLDVPLELRFSANPDDPSRSFKFSVGGRVGYLFSAHTKVKFTDDDGNKVKIKEKQDFNLNRFRYGVYAKIGGGNFSVMGYYNLSTVFKSGQGPVFGTNDPTEMNNFTIGISLSSF